MAGFNIGQKKANIAGGIVINTGKDEVIVIGKDYTLKLMAQQDNGKTLDIEFMEEGTVVDGKWLAIRRLKSGLN